MCLFISLDMQAREPRLVCPLAPWPPFQGLQVHQGIRLQAVLQQLQHWDKRRRFLPTFRATRPANLSFYLE